jgi:hypothetical protein
VSEAILIALGVCIAVLILTAVVRDERAWARADRRADLLVRELLTPDELEQLDGCGYLEVPSRLVPGRSYRVPAWPGRITVIEHGRALNWLCLQPVENVPARELVLLHKLMLEGSEEEYCQRANRTP